MPSFSLFSEKICKSSKEKSVEGEAGGGALVTVQMPSDRDLSIRSLSFLSLRDIFKLRLTLNASGLLSRQLEECIQKVITVITRVNLEEFMATMDGFSKNIRQVVLDGMYPFGFVTHVLTLDSKLSSYILNINHRRVAADFIGKISSLWKLSPMKRAESFIPRHFPRPDKPKHLMLTKLEMALVSDYGILALELKLITVEEAEKIGFMQLYYLLSEHGISALERKLISIDDILMAPGANLLSLFTEYGLLALEKGLITVQQALGEIDFSHRSVLFSKYGLLALEKGLITFQQAKDTDTCVLEYLMSERGILALEKGVITVQQASDIGYEQLESIFASDAGILALEQGLITVEQVKSAAWSLRYLFIPEFDFSFDDNPIALHGLEALQRKLITVEQVEQVSASDERGDHLKIVGLLSANGILALASGWITVDHIVKSNVVHFLLLDGEIVGEEFHGFSALRDGLITCEQAASMELEAFRALFSGEGFAALRDGLITGEQAASMELGALETLFSEHGISALRDGLITGEQAASMNGEVLDLLFSDGDVLSALREGLITSEAVRDLSCEEFWDLFEGLENASTLSP